MEVNNITSAIMTLINNGTVRIEGENVLTWSETHDKEVERAMAGYRDVGSIERKIKALDREKERLKSLL